MPSPTVSVIIPAYNAEAYVAEAISSALDQRCPPAEVIVVDDGSTDGTAAVVKGFGPRVTYIHQANARQAAARNTGIRHSSGELLAFLDADDIWEPDKLCRQVELLQSRPDVALAYCGAVEVGPDGAFGQTLAPQLRGVCGREILLGRGSVVLGSTMLARRSAMTRVGLFDDRLPPCEDMDLAWRIGLHESIDFVDAPLVRYRQHAAAAHRNLDLMEAAWRRLYAKALADPTVRDLGVGFRFRCYGRLYYMLAGDHALGGRSLVALRYLALAAAHWPPMLLVALRQRGRRIGLPHWR
jgi:glycosyltransferase involved in cell wall biosynthesis